MGINPYKSVNGYTVVYNHGAIKIITKDKIDVMEWVVYLPKLLIQFILENDLPSPLKASVLSLNEEVILHNKIKNSSWQRKVNSYKRVNLFERFSLFITIY